MPTITVAVALIVNENNEVLIARRHKHQHQGDLWEFPGGKREADESRLEALQREVFEEVGLKVNDAEPLLVIAHDYGDRAVELDVWLVTEFYGEAEGCEGQPIQWQAAENLDPSVFPAGNRQIIQVLQQRLSA